MKRTVCLIGKPNVGKSTIFNKLIKENKAIIMDEPGVTRDRIYGTVNYKDYSFLLIDTVIALFSAVISTMSSFSLIVTGYWSSERIYPVGAAISFTIYLP